MTNNLKEDDELLSNCCSARAYGEIDEATSTGRCSDCGDGCLFTVDDYPRLQITPPELTRDGDDFSIRATADISKYTKDLAKALADKVDEGTKREAKKLGLNILTDRELSTLINQKEKEARLDELERFEENEDGEIDLYDWIPMPELDTSSKGERISLNDRIDQVERGDIEWLEPRIKQLKEELNKKGK